MENFYVVTIQSVNAAAAAAAAEVSFCNGPPSFCAYLLLSSFVIERVRSSFSAEQQQLAMDCLHALLRGCRGESLEEMTGGGQAVRS